MARGEAGEPSNFIQPARRRAPGGAGAVCAAMRERAIECLPAVRLRPAGPSTLLGTGLRPRAGLTSRWNFAGWWPVHGMPPALRSTRGDSREQGPGPEEERQEETREDNEGKARGKEGKEGRQGPLSANPLRRAVPLQERRSRERPCRTRSVRFAALLQGLSMPARQLVHCRSGAAAMGLREMRSRLQRSYLDLSTPASQGCAESVAKTANIPA